MARLTLEFPDARRITSYLSIFSAFARLCSRSSTSLALYQHLHRAETEENRKLHIIDEQGEVIENIVFR